MTLHPPISDWIDFARGLTDPSRTEDMERHLSSGCERCQANLWFLRQISETAAAGKALPEAPAPIVRQAQAIFTVNPRPRKRTLRSLIPDLIFDSFSEAALAGVRSLRGTTRRLVYRAEQFELELLVDRSGRDQVINVVGQFRRLSGVEGDLPVVAVSMLDGQRTVGRAASNHRGEFQIEGAIGRKLLLRVSAPGDGIELNVPLGPLIA